MRCRGPTVGVARAVLLAWAMTAPAAAVRGQTAPERLDACPLLAAGELERVAARRLYGDPEPIALGGGAACDYGGGTAQLLLFAGADAPTRLDGFLRAFGQQDAPKHAVAEFGPGAYAVYPKPQNAYQDTVGLLVVPARHHLLAITLAAAEGEPAESTLPGLTALARLVVARLP
jgi:hypothetical protein